MLGTDVQTGLASAEAARRLRWFGSNLLPETRTGGSLRRVLRQFHHPLVYVLLASVVVSFLLGEVVDAAVILGVVLVNAAVGFAQESKAEAALDTLRSMVRTDARARRDGRQQILPSGQLVPGDVVLIEAGDKVPADLRLVELAELQVDESALTGESLPVDKDEVALPAETPVADRRNLLYSGTFVTHGSGVGVTVATGAETELGEIHRLMGTAESLGTPLTRKLARFSKVLTVAILGLAGLTFAAGVARGEDIGEMFNAAVALAVGAIPEGLPAAVTIVLAIGVSRMARRRAVIRRMPAVETLGSTTVVCSDKTGTLTENQMTVRSIWTSSDSFEVTGVGYQPDGAILDSSSGPVDPSKDEALRWALIAGAACNDARLAQTDDGWEVIGDPTEGAMLVAASKAGLDATWVKERFPRLATVPFSSERKYMETLHDPGGAGRVVLAKGAVERIVELCRAQMCADGTRVCLERDRVHSTAEELAGQGLRVLATAMAEVGDDVAFSGDGLSGMLTFTGLQAMSDPPRPAAMRAVASCRAAGIDVKMITGDHLSTARAIARQLGIIEEDDETRVLTGVDLSALTTDEYAQAVGGASVFARVSPDQKLRLVEALQGLGHVVAMTGDGVNDAPALKQADIGVAMGAGGTEVAKEAADMILVDDNFATIEAAVEEGRGVFDNLTKFITWTLPTNIGEGSVILVAILIGATLPIIPVQILWINMTTALALGMTLAFEPKEDDIMARPPRDPRRSLLTGTLLVRIALVSALLVGGAWWLFELERSNGASISQARTAALDLFVTVEAVYLFACRSLVHSTWSLGVLSNRWLLVGVATQAGAQAAITYIPEMNSIFQTAPIGARAWGLVAAVAAAASVVVALDKRLWRRRA